MPIIFEDYRRKRNRRRVLQGGLVVVAAVTGVFAGYAMQTPQRAPSSHPSVQNNTKRVVQEDSLSAEEAPSQPKSAPQSCTVVDGDTLRCSGQRIRLLGVDAPELPGHCRPGRVCVSGDPFASSAALQNAIADGEVRITVVGSDSYGRSLANVYVKGRNISCALIAQGYVQYVERWDNGRLVANDCPELSL